MKNRKFGILAVFAVILALFFAACGGSSHEDNTWSNGGGEGIVGIDSALYGTWRNDGGSLVVTFSADNITWGGSGTEGNFYKNLPVERWAAQNGKILATYSGSQFTVCNYRIESNGELRLTSPTYHTLTKDVSPGGGGGHDIDSALYGTWEEQRGGNIINVTFSADGITWGGSAGSSLNKDGATWTAKDGTIFYTWSGGTTTAFTYTINSSGNLLLTDHAGATTLTLIKK